jgi:hypothetical protein
VLTCRESSDFFAKNPAVRSGTRVPAEFPVDVPRVRAIEPPARPAVLESLGSSNLDGSSSESSYSSSPKWSSSSKSPSSSSKSSALSP